MYNDKFRHIHRRHSTIKQLILNGIISIDYVKSKENNMNTHMTYLPGDQVYCLQKEWA